MRSPVVKNIKVPTLLLDVLENLGLGDEIANLIRSVPMDLPAYDRLIEQLDEMSDDTSVPTYMVVMLARQIRQIRLDRKKRLDARVAPEDIKWELKPETVSGVGINYLHAAVLHMLGYRTEADGLLQGVEPSSGKAEEMLQTLETFQKKGVVSVKDNKALIVKLDAVIGA